MAHDRNQINSTVKRIAHNMGIHDGKIRISASSGNGWMGSGLDVELVDSEMEKHNFYVKVAPDSYEVRKICPIAKCFQREILAYTEVIPILDSLQNEIEDFDKVKFVKYFDSSEECNEFLIFEKLNGFHAVAELKFGNSLEEMYAVIRQLGKLHGLSFVMKERYPNKFDYLVKRCQEIYVGDQYKDDSHVVGYKHMIDLVFKTTNGYLEGEERVFNENIKDLAFELNRKAVNDCDYKVICHGDCHIWNFLFKYEGENRKTIRDCRMLDFQLLNISSPASDFQYLIGSTTSKDTREKYHDTFTELHYNTIGDTLAMFSMNIADIYPKNMYQKDLELCSVIAIVKANQSFAFGLGNPNNPPTLNDFFSGVLEKEQLKTKEECVREVQWVRESIRDFRVRYGHLYK